MYKTCPKCGYTRQPTDRVPAGECPSCGVIFEKYLKSQYRAAQREKPAAAPATRLAESLPGVDWQGLWGRFLEVEAPVNPVLFWGRVAVFVALFIWGWNFILMDYYYYVQGHRIDETMPEIGSSFMHSINLPFHEAGHVLFGPFGWFMGVLGGSLMQILMPLVVMFWFVLKEHNPFGGMVGLWWTGQSFMDLAPYVNDARAGQLLLLGGRTGSDSPGFHDWTNILGYLGVSHLDHTIAWFVDAIGVVLMLLSFAWGGLLLLRQYRLVRA